MLIRACFGIVALLAATTSAALAEQLTLNVPVSVHDITGFQKGQVQCDALSVAVSTPEQFHSTQGSTRPYRDSIGSAVAPFTLRANMMGKAGLEYRATLQLNILTTGTQRIKGYYCAISLLDSNGSMVPASSFGGKYETAGTVP